MLSLDALQVLDAIRRRGSFAAAAAELDRVPSAVSYTIQKLEEDVGVSLFRKSGRRAVLTPAGETLAAGAVELMRSAEALTESTRQTATGWESRLAIAIDTTIDREPIWRAISSLYEVHADIDISITEQVLGGTWEVLINDSVALTIGAVENLPDQYLAGRQGIRTVPWQPVDMCFIAAPDHPICNESQPLAADIIRSFRGVVIADTSNEFRALSRGTFQTGNVLYVDNMHEKLLAHLKGIGIGLLPRHLATPYLEAGDLLELHTELPAIPEPTSLAYRIGNRGKALEFLVAELTSSAR